VTRGAARLLLLGAATGAWLVYAAPPDGPYPLAFIAFVPLLCAADGRGCPGPALAGWVAGVVFYVGLADFLPATIAELQGVRRSIAWACFALFAGAHALQFAAAFGAAALLGGRTRRRAWVSVALARAAAWVWLEWAFPKVFPWSVGNALGPDARLRQGAELGGVYGLGLLVMLVNALLAESARGGSAPSERLHAAAAAAALLGLAMGYGAWRSGSVDRPASSRAPRVAVVQGGIGPVGQDPGTATERDFSTYAALSRAAAPAADLLVWPESALRIYVRDNEFFRARVAELARDAHRPLLLGALDRPADGAGELNSAYLFAATAMQRPAVVYHKAALLPFGEYVPGASWWPVLRHWRTTGEFVRGEPPVPLATELRGVGVRLAPSICFEAVRAGAFNQQVRRGAVLLVNLTDDSWFASPRAAGLHLELVRLRAVETRRWLVRASASGISAFIDPGGRVVARLPLGATGALTHAVALRRSRTPYVCAGDWVPALCAGLVALRVLQMARLRRDRRAAPRLRRRREWRVGARR